MKNKSTITDLQSLVSQFGKDRHWEKFHSPKNISMALSVEASELVEIFQWLTEKQSESLDANQRDSVRFELADIFMYTLLMSERLDIDLEQATRDKIKLNEKRFNKA